MPGLALTQSWSQTGTITGEDVLPTSHSQVLELLS